MTQSLHASRTVPCQAESFSKHRAEAETSIVGGEARSRKRVLCERVFVDGLCKSPAAPPGAGEAPTTTEFCDRQRGPIAPVRDFLLWLWLLWWRWQWPWRWQGGGSGGGGCGDSALFTPASAGAKQPEFAKTTCATIAEMFLLRASLPVSG